jgi:hypothetical protein
MLVSNGCSSVMQSERSLAEVVSSLRTMRLHGLGPGHVDEAIAKAWRLDLVDRVDDRAPPGSKRPRVGWDSKLEITSPGCTTRPDEIRRVWAAQG